MPEYLENPRRTPRAPARCPTLVLTAWGRFDAETVDVGPRGCQLVSPRPVRRGEAVHLEISNAKKSVKLDLNAHVAWAGARSPWRLGIAFSPAGDRGDRWFDGLIDSYPALEGYRRVSQRIPMDATIYLGRPPSAIIDFTEEEFELLRAIANGARIDELRERFGGGWPGAERALFSLLARCHVTSSRGAAVGPALWSQILGDARSPDAPAPPTCSTESAVKGQPNPSAPPPLSCRSDLTPLPSHVARTEVRSSDQVTTPDYAGAGVGWRSPAKPRCPEADEQYQRALLELEAGRYAKAVVLLRRAISLAPGDPVIAQKLGDAAFANS